VIACADTAASEHPALHWKCWSCEPYEGLLHFQRF